MEMRSMQELDNWAKGIRMWKQKVDEFREMYEAGLCTEAEYANVLDQSTAYSRDMIKALS